MTQVSALGPGVCEILYVSSKSGAAISHSPLAFPKLSPTGLQRRVFCGLIFQVWDPWAWEPDVGLRSLALGEKLCSSNYPPFLCAGYLVVWVLTVPRVCLYYSSYVPLYFYL